MGPRQRQRARRRRTHACARRQRGEGRGWGKVTWTGSAGDVERAGGAHAGDVWKSGEVPLQHGRRAPQSAAPTPAPRPAIGRPCIVALADDGGDAAARSGAGDAPLFVEPGVAALAAPAAAGAAGACAWPWSSSAKLSGRMRIHRMRGPLLAISLTRKP